MLILVTLEALTIPKFLHERTLKEKHFKDKSDNITYRENSEMFGNSIR